MAHLLLN